MRLIALASLFTAAVMWFALGGNPAQSQSESKPTSCQTCGKKAGAQCPHCASGETCPHCDEGKTCPHCGSGKGCVHAHHGHHGKWGSHKREYKCVRPSKKPAEMTKQISGLGEDGWKLMEADGGIWCFAKIRAN